MKRLLMSVALIALSGSALAQDAVAIVTPDALSWKGNPAQSAATHPVVLMDISALTAESDFSVFMDKAMPEDVRRTALRRLWVLMQVPVSCFELCYEQRPEAELFAPRGPSATR
jgi:hypothetical protein